MLPCPSQLLSCPHSSPQSPSGIPFHNSKPANDFDRLNKDSQKDWPLYPKQDFVSYGFIQELELPPSGLQSAAPYWIYQHIISCRFLLSLGGFGRHLAWVLQTQKLGKAKLQRSRPKWRLQSQPNGSFHLRKDLPVYLISLGNVESFPKGNWSLLRATMLGGCYANWLRDNLLQ